VHHQHKVSPHGKEWKSFFSNLLAPLMGKNIFPPSVEKALIKYIKNPGASSCSDPHLFRALLAFDRKDENYSLVEELPTNSLFKSTDGHTYKLLEKRRTRYVCEQVGTHKKFLFPSLMHVFPINSD
jgi:SprT protein